MKDRKQKHEKMIKNFDDQLKLANQYLKAIISIEKKSQTTVGIDELINRKSGTLQKHMMKYGLGTIGYRPPFSNAMMNNFQIFANFPEMLYGKFPEDAINMIQVMKTNLYTYLETLENEKKIAIEKFNSTDLEESEETIDDVKDIQIANLANLEVILVDLIYNLVLLSPSAFSQSRNITPERKKEVKKRDKYICQETFKEEELQVDHIFPHSLGGSNQVYNLMAICKECNQDKNNRLDYYRGDEGREKVRTSIMNMVRTLPMITDFQGWLIKMGDKRRRS